MKKFTFFLSALLISMMSFAGEVEMSTFTATSADMDGYISYSTNQGGGTTAPAINNGVIRLYQNNNGDAGGNITITAKPGTTITAVTIGSDMDTQIKWEVNGTVDASTTELKKGSQVTISDLSASAVTCHCYGADKSHRLYVNYLKITYTASETPGEGGGETPEPTPDPEEPGDDVTGNPAATIAAGENGSACTVNEKDGIKVGTSSKGGSMTITVPANATALQFYAAAWKGVTDLSINITPDDKVATASIELTADAGIANSTPFTLSGEEASFYYEVALNNITEETTLTVETSIKKRFVIWGVTYTAGSNEGGETPDPTPDPEEPEEPVVPEVPENLGAKTIAEFLELKNTTDTCVLTGVVANIVNTTYGNFDLVDATGSVYVYGLLTAAGEKQQFASMDIAAGDTLTVKAIYNEYNGNPQAKNAIYVSHTKAAAPIVPENLGAKTIAEFLELKNTTDTCVLTGVVANIVNTTYGNFDLVDATGSVYVYGLLTAAGEKQQFASMDIAAGDTLTVKAIYNEYNGNPQAKNAIYVSHTKAAAPVVPENLGAKTIAEFLELKNTTDTCVLTGVVANIVNTTYGNFDLVDATGSVYVYGLLTAAGEKQQFASMDIAAGDTLTVKAIYNEFNSKAQAKNAIYVSHSKLVLTVEVTSENGTVDGLADGGKYVRGAKATLTATANEGYEFVNWTEGEEVVSTDAEYTFEVLADRALVANFKAVGPTVGLENLDTTVAPVKVIENGQLIIIKDGVKYNAQGQVVK